MLARLATSIMFQSWKPLFSSVREFVVYCMSECGCVHVSVTLCVCESVCE